jgi:hypothetical protein
VRCVTSLTATPSTATEIIFLRNETINATEKSAGYKLLLETNPTLPDVG